MMEDIIVVVQEAEPVNVIVDNLSVSVGDMSKATYDADGDGVVDGSESLILTIVANEDIPAHSLVTSTGYIADSSNLAHLNKVSGIALKDIAANTSGKVISYGKVANTNWNFTTGNILYLNETSISEVPPTSGFVCQIGKAISTNTILVDIKACIKL